MATVYAMLQFGRVSNTNHLLYSPPEDMCLCVPALNGTREAVGLVCSLTHPIFMYVTVSDFPQRNGGLYGRDYPLGCPVKSLCLPNGKA